MSKDIAQIHKLKEDILAGNTTYSDVERRLSAAIEAEYDREDANIDYINACEDLLLEMHTDGELPSFPTSEEYAIEMQKHMLVKKERSFLPKLAWRCAAVLAAMLVIVLLGDQVFHWQWFSGTSTENEQQYVIQGHEITVPMIAESIAEHEEYDEIATSSYQDIVQFLGFEPSVPNIETINTTSVQYIAVMEPNMVTLTIRYTNTGNRQNDILFTAQYCTNVQDAYFWFEQDLKGTMEQINGMNVYWATNTERSTYTWIDGTIVYHLASNKNNPLGFQIVTQLTGGKKHE